MCLPEYRGTVATGMLTESGDTIEDQKKIERVKTWWCLNRQQLRVAKKGKQESDGAKMKVDLEWPTSSSVCSLPKLALQLLHLSAALLAFKSFYGK
ncbi:hypothetical protein Nepgr_001979 [Nepenthes gracilis]|uniref:Uncharacterized protein n=1 Tax=Nepenthes gracilis TaxID=150966 RepID=A0AAD3RY60_NEPGR|nr:hypothetical protein Nepgr_001979 [Nepenthes gracilis]